MKHSVFGFLTALLLALPMGARANLSDINIDEMFDRFNNDPARALVNKYCGKTDTIGGGSIDCVYDGKTGKLRGVLKCSIPSDKKFDKESLEKELIEYCGTQTVNREGADPEPEPEPEPAPVRRNDVPKMEPLKGSTTGLTVSGGIEERNRCTKSGGQWISGACECDPDGTDMSYYDEKSQSCVMEKIAKSNTKGLSVSGVKANEIEKILPEHRNCRDSGGKWVNNAICECPDTHWYNPETKKCGERSKKAISLWDDLEKLEKALNEQITKINSSKGGKK